MASMMKPYLSSHQRPQEPFRLSRLVSVGINLLSLLTVLLALLVFWGCQGNDNIYQPHEEALLQITVENILALEKDRDYAAIYDDFASEEMKSAISRRRFLEIANCTERYLGGYQYFERSTYVLTRQPYPVPPGLSKEAQETLPKHIEELNLKVYRDETDVTERMLFVRQGLDFKLKALRWHTDHPDFLGCLRQLADKEKPAEK